MESKLESCSVTSELVVGAGQHFNTLPEGSEKDIVSQKKKNSSSNCLMQYSCLQ